MVRRSDNESKSGAARLVVVTGDGSWSAVSEAIDKINDKGASLL